MVMITTVEEYHHAQEELCQLEERLHRFWAAIEELDGRILRVVPLEDKTTVHNAFPDRGLRP